MSTEDIDEHLEKRRADSFEQMRVFGELGSLQASMTDHTTRLHRLEGRVVKVEEVLADTDPLSQRLTNLENRLDSFMDYVRVPSPTQSRRSHQRPSRSGGKPHG